MASLISSLFRYWGVIGGVGLFMICYIILLIIWIGCDRYDWDWAYDASVFLAKRCEFNDEFTITFS